MMLWLQRLQAIPDLVMRALQPTGPGGPPEVWAGKQLLLPLLPRPRPRATRAF